MAYPLCEVVPVRTSGSRVTVYLMSCEDIEKFLTAKYGKKLMAVNQASLARQNEKREKWRKSVVSETGFASGDQ